MDYENKVLCAKCSEVCCKEMPGAAFPEDFDANNLHTALVEAFKSGHWAVGWWEGDPTDGNRDRTYYLRPATKAATSVFDPTWGGECIFLSPIGCMLSLEQRPRECRELEPIEDHNCVDHAGGKGAAAVAWIPYEETVLHAANEVNGTTLDF